MRRFFLVMLLLLQPMIVLAQQSLPTTIQQIKPAIVAIGIYNPTASPRVRLVGTGFVVNPGNQVVTNYHVVASALDTNRQEEYVVLSGQANQVVQHKILQQRSAMAYDLAVLTIQQKLPALAVRNSPELIAEGTEIAFTGFPITQVLGLYPATHRGIIAAQTPVAIPVDNSANLHAAAIRRLGAPYLVYQLDATAYPGNSGSPLYLPESGQVIGIINQVHIKSTREAVLSDPSGITYAIPVQHLLPLLSRSE
ncbi:MAG: serine protease [Alishewanella agri]|nr:serine protease [Alishewanella agri]